MKCPTRACSGAIHRITDWNIDSFCDYVAAICNHCNCQYWLIRRDGDYYFQDKQNENFIDQRSKQKKEIKMKKYIVGLVIASAILFAPAIVIAETVGKVSTSGLVFKDHITVEAFDDPSINGITCYTTVHSRALSLSDSSSVSLSCRKVAVISGNLRTQKNIFSRSKSVFFKKTVVDRFYDAKRGVLVYLTYTKGGGQNNSHSVSVVVVQ